MTIGLDPNEGLIKVRVHLLGSALESGYESETLWAEDLGEQRYRIWNLPVYAYNIGMRDIVECAPDPEGGLPVVTRVLEQGDCFTVRLYFSAAASDSEIESVLGLLSERRVLFEKSDRLLWAIGLRSREDYDWIGTGLEPFISSGSVALESAYQVAEPPVGAT